MTASSLTLSSQSIYDPTIPSQRSDREPEQNITALPPTGYGETDPWAKYRQQSTDTLDCIPPPVNHPMPAHAQAPASTVGGQATAPTLSSTRSPPYPVQSTHRQSKRFPVKASNAPPAQPQSSRANSNPVATNEPSNGTFHNIPLENTARNDDIEKQKIAVQYKGMQGAWTTMKWKLVTSAVIAVVGTIILVVVCLEVRKDDPEEFGKI